jgi:TPR repeat protein
MKYFFFILFFFLLQDQSEVLFNIGKKNDINNPVKALEYYKQASEMGHIDSLYEIGNIFHYGAKGVPRDHTVAIRFYKKQVKRVMPLPCMY